MQPWKFYGTAFSCVKRSSRIPIAIAHDEGHADAADKTAVNANAQIELRYVDNYGQVTEAYPANPNGSVDVITGLTATVVE